MTQVQARAKNDFTAIMQQRSVEDSPRWVRVKFGGEFVADSRRVLLLIEYGPGRLPTYYFPQDDVRMDLLKPSAEPDPAGEFEFYDVTAGGKTAERAARVFANPPAGLERLKGHVTFDWNAMDAWYEEEAQVFVHARDPYRRIDVLPSSRHVRVEVAGQPVADTRRPSLLFETGLPTRYYIPREDVRMDLLEPTDNSSRCPYKGIASYWSVRAGDQLLENIVWSYPEPIAECPGIKDLLCFYNERVDIYVDGELEERPRSFWS
jgi:uncharacterized protein (DUF427 family)